MGVFGPRYPAPLQAVMNRAERFCALLSCGEGLYTPRDARARAWRTGRTEEISLVLALLAGDWESGRVGVGAATRAAAAYLDDLHAGARVLLGGARVFACCVENDARTVLAPAGDAVTRLLEGVAPAARPADETLFDPRGMLLDVFAEEHSVDVEATGGLSALGSSEKPCVRSRL